MNEAIGACEGIAREAGRIQLERFGRARHIEFKGAIDIVTEVDRACEAFIVGELGRLFPGDAILAEEGSGKAGAGGGRRKWIVDPLDGTVNYAHGFPFFCCSIALEEGGELAGGVIYDPNRDELFRAARGEGAFRNGERIRVSGAGRLGEALVATGFAYNVREEERLNNLDNFARFVKRAQAVRRPGSAAIDLAWLACGRIDGFWELFLRPWDMAAGVAIIREAGGTVTSFDGSAYDLYGTQILASNGRIHDEMVDVLKM
jgi:myo-inositol-1(or 4)-monophosphatase